MGHRDQDGKKVDEKSLFFLKTGFFYKLGNKETKKLYFEHFDKNTKLWASSAHPRLRLKPEILFWTIFLAKIR